MSDFTQPYIDGNPCRRHVRAPALRPTNDDLLGMAWWNRLTKIERMAALLAADTACPAQAWHRWQLRGGAHGLVVDNAVGS